MPVLALLRGGGSGGGGVGMGVGFGGSRAEEKGSNSNIIVANHRRQEEGEIASSLSSSSSSLADANADANPGRLIVANDGRKPTSRRRRRRRRRRGYGDVASRMNDIFELVTRDIAVGKASKEAEDGGGKAGKASASSSTTTRRSGGGKAAKAVVAEEQYRRNLRAVVVVTEEDDEDDEDDDDDDAFDASYEDGDGDGISERTEHLIEETFDNAMDVEDIFLDVIDAAEADVVVVVDNVEAAPYSSSQMRLDEDYFADLPDFVLKDFRPQRGGVNGGNGNGHGHGHGHGGAGADAGGMSCRCIDCDEDRVCGGIWKRERFASPPPPSPSLASSDHDYDNDDDDDTNNGFIPGTVDLTKAKIHMVVSHCMSDLDWIDEWTKGPYEVVSVHVITKCGKADRARLTAPSYATVEEYENLGRCDHTYAYYVTTVLPARIREGEEEDSIAIFLKDDISAANFHQSGHWNDFDGLVRAAGSKHGFGCGIIPGGVDFGRDSFDLSTYHETKTLHSFSMDTYNRSKGGRYKIDLGEFLSKFKNVAEWYHAMGAPPPPEAMQVCYGGVFSGSVRNIYKSTDINSIRANMDTSMWKNVEISLSRGNNIQEGHFAERSWAPMIQTHLPKYQLEALLRKTDGVYLNKSSFHGALLSRPKLFVHVGSELGSGGNSEMVSSTEALTESLVRNMELLELDGYKVAVHGKYEDGRHGFPKIDHLGACMWSDMNKSLLPPHQKDVAVCDDETLPALSSYMKETFHRSQDMVLLNPWLVRPGSAEPLSIYLDYVWDVRVVMYYRRFFEWISYKYEAWRKDLMEKAMSADAVPESYRYIDFLREYCKKLFYGRDVNEDGFPVRKLHRRSEKKSPMTTMMTTTTSVSAFEPTTNYDLEDLTGLEDYVYFVAKQYHNMDRFRRGIKIVNYHDMHSVETNFYCHVLHDSPNSCNAAVRQEMEKREESGGTSRQPKLPGAVDKSVALEDIVIEAYLAGRLEFDASQPRKKFVSQISLWTDMLSLALQRKDMFVEHLPLDCLYKYERRRLLEASLAYEKDMLPEFFASPKGAANLKASFEENRFCSVDTGAVLSDPGWDFLFDEASNFTVAKQRTAFVHVGAPRTGGELIRSAMAADEGVLKEDGYLTFEDGGGHLAPCVWSDAQLEADATDEDDGVDDVGGIDVSCNGYFRPRFHQFLHNASVADSDVIISDEGLSEPSSEMGLLNILDENFDPVVTIYYRRFFDWILATYSEWQLEAGIATLESMRGKVRLVDYIRLLCSRLFTAAMNHPGDKFVDLPYTPEYSYHSWKRFTDLPEYENSVKVLNFHDKHTVQSFYCDVLQAETTCKLELDRRDNDEAAESPVDSLVSKYAEMAMGLNWDKGLSSKEHLHTLTDGYKEKLARRGLSEDDLPKECLSQAETGMLFKVSREYERMLLPDYYSAEGEEEMRRHFTTLLANGTFCSVDVEKVADSLKWQFLFEPFDKAVVV